MGIYCAKQRSLVRGVATCRAMGLGIAVGQSHELGALENKRGERPGLGVREKELGPG